MPQKETRIKKITCHKLLNSRGEWTIGTKVELEDGCTGVQSIPDGASKGEHEAVYLLVDKAVDVVSSAIDDALRGEDASDQEKIDEIMIKMDGTSNKSHLGGNSILSVSLACAKAVAQSRRVELYEYIADLSGNTTNLKENPSFPTPVFNILNGGKHAHNGLSFQEFMVIPSPSLHYKKAVEIGVEVYHLLKDKLILEGQETDVGDEGGFAPMHFHPEKALEYIKEACSKRYKPGVDLFFGMDVASGSFYSNGVYVLDELNQRLDSDGLSAYYEKLLKKFEIIYLEDPFFERDYDAWKKFYNLNHKKFMIVGDDLVVTNPKILEKTIKEKMINAVIVKPNQVGTLTETLEFIKEAKKAGMSIVVSHRSGDTAEDTFISDLAVGVSADFIKAGAPARGERVAKYNRLLEIYDYHMK